MLEQFFLPQPTNLTERSVDQKPPAIVAISNLKRAEDRIPPGIINGAPAEMLKNAKEFREKAQKEIKSKNPALTIKSFRIKHSLPALSKNFPIAEVILEKQSEVIEEDKQVVEFQTMTSKGQDSLNQIDLAAIEYRESLLDKNIKLAENQPKRGIYSILPKFKNT